MPCLGPQREDRIAAGGAVVAQDGFAFPHAPHDSYKVFDHRRGELLESHGLKIAEEFLVQGPGRSGR